MADAVPISSITPPSARVRTLRTKHTPPFPDPPVPPSPEVTGLPPAARQSSLLSTWTGGPDPILQSGMSLLLCRTPADARARMSQGRRATQHGELHRTS